MDDPSTFVVDPVCVGVEAGGLIDHFFGCFFDTSDGDEGRGSCSTVRWSFDGWRCGGAASGANGRGGCRGGAWWTDVE